MTVITVMTVWTWIFNGQKKKIVSQIFKCCIFWFIFPVFFDSERHEMEDKLIAEIAEFFIHRFVQSSLVIDTFVRSLDVWNKQITKNIEINTHSASSQITINENSRFVFICSYLVCTLMEHLLPFRDPG